MDPQVRQQIETSIGHVFTDGAILEQSLTHASVTERRTDSNERLEFLGDAVLGLVTCELIFAEYPDLLEGEMTKIKSTVVSRQTCAAVSRDLGLDQLLVLGRGMQWHTVLPQSLAAAALEAIVAAVYLDAGLEAARKFLRPILGPLIRRAFASGHQENFKSVLQQHAQQSLQETPIYLVLDEKGPDHAKCFEVCVEIGTRRFDSAWGQSKKQAEQLAALAALRALGLVQNDEGGHVRVARTGTDAG
ncbi:MAG: ribonuclease III [Phycisphaeraceae bacterium]|nr:ribonuclease III [Phycisphaeraceae bacterium]